MAAEDLGETGRSFVAVEGESVLKWALPTGEIHVYRMNVASSVVQTVPLAPSVNDSWE